MPVNRRLIAIAIGARLATVRNTTGYYGQIGRPLPGVDPAGFPTDPPPKSAQDPRVKPYFVYYPGAGDPGPDTSLASCGDDATLTFRITAAAGDVDELLALIDRIHAALHLWTPIVAGHVCGRIRHPIGYTAGSVLNDTSVNPHRIFVSLPYQVTATT